MENAIAIQNLGAYNRGELRFKWVELPTTTERIKEAIKEVLNTPYNDEEYHIADYNDCCGLLYEYFGEWASPYEVNEFMELVEESGLDKEVISLLADCVSTKEEFKEVILEDEDYFILYEVSNERELGLELVYEFNWLGLSKEELDKVENYLDYEYIGREAGHDGWVIDRVNRVAVKVNR
ncbi:antirestriction protein ArdA [Orenia metallireducens]|uniref:Antirestriction protein (ArdA) n=2 Tax=Orenia TaxID=46468 RepID=A0A285IFU2_9FIRM|nr:MULTISPECIES: antirestriction protein ArdA [Orenia]PRX20160.1 antirestriction protein ArdA [Orenia metallireducens]TDX48826.1 antirestriction protein ArdA [Orenia marismortui]SNY45811.1 Antirestriction protein (ArdA) [Orenia metallireducens]